MWNLPFLSVPRAHLALRRRRKPTQLLGDVVVTDFLTQSPGPGLGCQGTFITCQGTVITCQGTFITLDNQSQIT